MKKINELIIFLILAGVCLLVFWSSFKYGFVSDDYNRITIHSINQLIRSWTNVNFRRPLDELYYFLFYSLFGYNPLPYRIFLFFTYLINSFLVYRIAYILTKNYLFGCVIAILFAANPVQFRNIYWISCNLLLFATTFYLISILLFLYYLKTKDKKMWWITFITATIGVILTKEDVVTFPLISVLIVVYVLLSQKDSLDSKDLAHIARATSIFWLIPFIFIGFRTIMAYILGGNDKCPYNLLDCFSSHAESLHRVNFLGLHVVKNLARHWFYNIGSLGGYWIDKPFNPYAGNLEWRSLSSVEYIIIISFLAGLGMFYWSLRNRYNLSWWYLIAGMVWFIGALSPTLVLPDYIQTYFSAFPAVGLFLILIMPFHKVVNSSNRKVIYSGISVFIILFFG